LFARICSSLAAVDARRQRTPAFHVRPFGAEDDGPALDGELAAIVFDARVGRDAAMRPSGSARR
jgi:hypothetical protein